MKKTFADYGIPVTKSSGHERTICPKCSALRKKSTQKCLSVDIDKGVWLCFHCGWHGSLGSAYSLKYQRPKYTPKPIKKESKVKQFFRNRKISEDVLVQNNISECKPGIACLPYIKGGQVVNVKYRAVAEKKFYQSKNCEPCLYRFDAISMLEGPLVITEGELDCLAGQTAGWERITSIPNGAIAPGTKSFESKFDFLESAEEIIKKCSKIILAMDADPPGQAMLGEMVRRIGPEKCWYIEYPEGCKDLNDILMKYDADILLDCINDAKPCPVKGLSCVNDYKDKVLDRLFGIKPPRPKTGWSYLDNLYIPDPGLISIVTGIPSAGKSTFMDNLLLRLHENNGWRFAVFSPENWPIDRHISLLIQKRLRRTEKELCEVDVRTELDALNDFVYFIYLKDTMLTIDNILARARAAVYRYGIRGLIIDPWNEVSHQYQGMTEAQYLEKSLSKVREFASSNQVHVWIVAHPREMHRDASGQYPPPTMYQINGGAMWRNKADFGLCVHRQKDKSKVSVTTVYIQKIRFRDYGKEGKVDFTVKLPGLFYELDPIERSE